MNVMECIEEPRVQKAEEKLAFPVDVRDWVAEGQLKEWVVSVVEGLNWDNPELIDGLKRNPDFEPKALLRAVSYAYLTGLFGAEEIVRACSENPDYRSIRPKLPPRAEEISTFRKLNRGILHLVLVQVLIKVLRTQFVEGERIAAFPAGLRRMIVENSFERLNIARHFDRTGEA